jgi:hypothetical protein
LTHTFSSPGDVTEGDFVADSGSVRTRRYRLHQAGDHSLCKQCAALREPSGPVTPAELGAPAAELRELAARLAGAHRADPGNALLGRELRLTLQALMGGEQADGELAALFAELGAS